MDRLEKMLWQVPGAYPEFVHWILGDAHEFGTADKIIDYILSHPEAHDDDVIIASAGFGGLNLE